MIIETFIQQNIVDIIEAVVTNNIGYEPIKQDGPFDIKRKVNLKDGTQSDGTYTNMIYHLWNLNRQKVLPWNNERDKRLPLYTPIKIGVININNNKMIDNLYNFNKKESDILKGKWEVEYQPVLDKLVLNFGFSSLEELRKKGTQKHLKEYFVLESELLEKFAKEKNDFLKKINNYDA